MTTFPPADVNDSRVKLPSTVPGAATRASVVEPVTVSTLRFPDDGAFRLEIPSVEGPGPLEAVISDAADRGVVLHRVSQGSGVAMLSDDEIESMVAQCAESKIELCLFLGPRGTWDIGGGVFSPSGGVGARVRGSDQLRFSIEDAIRATSLGVRCLLVADEGVLWTLHCMRLEGTLPKDLRLKMSALSGPANPASFAIVEGLGADSINVPGDLDLASLASLRQAGRAAIDLYVESPDTLGGFVRYHEVPSLISALAPVYLKFGLRNAPDIYPSGLHLSTVAVATVRERVRRAALMMEALERQALAELASPQGSWSGLKLHRFASVPS